MLARQFKRMIRADKERFLKRMRREMVLDLVNLSDDSSQRFRNRFRPFTPPMDDPELLQQRDQLRRFWSGDDQYQSSRKEFFRFGLLHSWLQQARQSAQNLWIVGTYGDGTHSLEPNYFLLPLSLALAASELSVAMGICGNPHCPQKYFLKGRRTQRFCDRPACSAYGQRQHKLKWWEAHKGELRPKPTNKKQREKRKWRN